MNEDYNPTVFFGEPYPSREWCAPVYEGATEIPTPVGETCLDCDESIEQGDRGFRQLYVGGDGTSHWCYYHHECSIRSVLGSAKHQRGEYPTRREAARAALAEFEKWQ